MQVLASSGLLGCESLAVVVPKSFASHRGGYYIFNSAGGACRSLWRFVCRYPYSLIHSFTGKVSVFFFLL